MYFKQELREVSAGVISAVGRLEKADKNKLVLATGIMLIAGFLVNLPAVILGRFVDKAIMASDLKFETAVPFLV